MIIVDDGSTDGTAEMLKALREHTNYELVICTQARGGSGPARNTGGVRSSR